MTMYYEYNGCGKPNILNVLQTNEHYTKGLVRKGILK